MADSDICAAIAENLQLNYRVIHTVADLLRNENTVPFIARYRKERTGGLDPTVLRQIETQYEQLKTIRERAEAVSKKIGDSLTPELRKSLKCAVSLEEVEEIYAPFKKGTKASYAVKARQLGLGETAALLLDNPKSTVQLEKLVRANVEGIKNLEQVKLGIQHILADVIARDTKTLNSIKGKLKNRPIVLESSLSRTASKEMKNGGAGDKKYERYHEFSSPITSLKAHQVLAVNRGEQNKILSIKMLIPEMVEKHVLSEMHETWTPSSAPGNIKGLFRRAVDDSYSRLIKPKICRHARSALTREAEKDSVDLFGVNLYRLLLTPPIRGKIVLGLDPGFSHGCKLAVLSSTGDVLDTNVIYPFGRKSNIHQARAAVVDLVIKHSCDYVAVGNGVGCREAETFISQLIKERAFSPLEIAYCIVSEDGASVYSASEDAAKELPNLDPSLRGAVSIGRRLQDPLVELVKIEPKHLGIGMYQHDIPEILLRGTLNGVVEDCVSFVGVDLNVAGPHMLRRLAGLNDKKAKAILTWREQNGPFTNREQLKAVKGIGLKTYEQCAGFVRITAPYTTSSCQRTAGASSEPGVIVIDSDVEDSSSTCGKKRKALSSTRRNIKKKKIETELQSAPNPLDKTWIHPESYDVAHSVMKMLGVQPDHIGQPDVKSHIDSFLKSNRVEDLATKLGVGLPTLQHIIDGLRQPSDHDIRTNFQKPLFKRHLTSLEDLHSGTELSGRVTNLTTFGAFVDCGVGTNGLIHKSKMGRFSGKVGLGDLVDVIVIGVDITKQHLNLGLRNISTHFDPQLLVSSCSK